MPEVHPKRDGRSVFQAIRSIRPTIPVLYCSGYSPETLPGPELGTDAPLLRKPYGSKELLRAVSEAPEGSW